LLCLVFTVSLACRRGDRSLVYILKTSGWKYFIISVIDVEANYLVVKAYSYTTIISIQVRKTSFNNRNVEVFYYLFFYDLCVICNVGRGCHGRHRKVV
jgi:solute carrier family 35 protein F1/2